MINHRATFPPLTKTRKGAAYDPPQSIMFKYDTIDTSIVSGFIFKKYGKTVNSVSFVNLVAFKALTIT